MKKLNLFSGVLVALNFLVIAMFVARPRPWLQLVSMLAAAGAFLFLIGSLFAGRAWYSCRKLRAFLATLICLVGVPLGMIFGAYAGHALRDWRFKRNLPRYREVIGLMESGQLKTRSIESHVVDLPARYRDLADVTLFLTNSRGAVTIEFIIGGGSPVKHTGYLYVAKGSIDDDAATLRRWPDRRKLDDHWLEIWD